MMSNNKILTVSYGTFSCTLEGFDDSFGTMKAIAEYFRDLASDDRYFGAEPPQPDVEMLSRIAQKEISRRVEVREHGGRIVLSATDTANQVEPDAPTDVAPLVAPQINVQAEAMIAAEAARAAQAQAEEQAENARVQASADAKAAEAIAQAAAVKAQDDSVAVQLVPRDLAAELPETEAFFASNGVSDIDETEIAQFEVSDIDLDATQPEMAQAPHDDSIAAKLQRIRAVVSNAELARDDDDFSEDQHADDFGSGAALETSEVAAELDDELAADIDISEAAADVEGFDIADFSVDTSADTEMEAIEASTKVDLRAAAVADIQAASDVDEVAEIAEQSDIVERGIAEIDDEAMSAVLARLAGEGTETTPQVAIQDTAEVAEPASAENLFDDSIDGEEDATLNVDHEKNMAPRRIARVIKVKRADLEAAIAEGDLEEIDDDDQPADSSLTDEDESELLRELANVEAELEDHESETLFQDATFEDAVSETPRNLRKTDDVESEDLSRLLAEADQQMNDEEGKKSRAAFSHLRAAVAAKNADTITAEPTTEEEEGAYRSDLATVVKPRRPVAVGTRPERAEKSERPAPLRLVAEQRVDPVSMPAGPVRPRRVALQEAAINKNPLSFAQLVDDTGATELADLLEAAAAYMSFVEGHEQFTRRELMNKIHTVEKQVFSREDSLRSFGKLLRAGKIEKRQSGNFTVTDNIGYHPETRAAG